MKFVGSFAGSRQPASGYAGQVDVLAAPGTRHALVVRGARGGRTTKVKTRLTQFARTT